MILSKDPIVRVILVIILFLPVISMRADEPQLLIAKANKAYSEGHYGDAVDLYKQVIKKGFESPALYYNLGNAYFKLSQYPPAILFYEKARKLDPGNDDIEFNLQIANSKIADKIEVIPDIFYIRWYKMVTGLFSFDTWAKITILLFIVFLVMAGIYYISRILVLRKTGFWTSVVVLILTVFTLLFSFETHHRFINQKEAIVFSPTVTIKSSPDDKSIDLFVIHEGTKVRILDQIGGWFEIQIANGSKGWLPAGTLERI